MENKSNKKKVSIYVNPYKYQRLKSTLGAMNITVTDFMDTMITDFIDSMEVVIKSNDQDLFLKMMSDKANLLNEEISNSLKANKN